MGQWRCGLACRLLLFVAFGIWFFVSLNLSLSAFTQFGSDLSDVPDSFFFLKSIPKRKNFVLKCLNDIISVIVHLFCISWCFFCRFYFVWISWFYSLNHSSNQAFYIENILHILMKSFLYDKYLKKTLVFKSSEVKNCSTSFCTNRFFRINNIFFLF